MSIKSADQYIRRVNSIPSEAKSILTRLRRLDIKSLEYQIKIRAKRELTIEKVIEYQKNKESLNYYISLLNEKNHKKRGKYPKYNLNAFLKQKQKLKNNSIFKDKGETKNFNEDINRHIESKQEIEQLLKDINNTHILLIQLCQQKKQLADKLYNYVDQPTEQLESDLSKLIPQQNANQQKLGKGRRGKKAMKQQYLVSEPNYCYCKQPSFGLMVKCQNQECDIEWFHMDCLNKQNQVINQHWICKDCRKLSERSKKY